ncbi:MAG: alanine racemase [Pseudobutyrivibrio sp.]|nr:alanine racemase [Pseudobutyrivibrio sp.]
MNNHKRVCAVINLDNIKHNMSVIYEHLGSDTPIMAVIKANGYGHGSIEVAKALESTDYIYGFAVATIEEAVAIRALGIKKPIMILGFVFEDDYEKIVKYNIRPCVSSLDMARKLSACAALQNKNVKIHVKIDTGMHRIGFDCSDNSVEEIALISELPNIEMEGMFTHFSKADESDKNFSTNQFKKFLQMKEALLEKNVEFEVYHCANSAAILDLKDYKLDLVRSGITTYGLWPSDEVKKDLNLKPALSLYSHVSFVKKLKAGEPVSYGGTFLTDKDSVIATIPVGYADGYARSLSNKGFVLIHGKRAKIVGRICMDQFMVDVTDIEGTSIGDEVVLIGRMEDESITIEELGELSGRFNYEFVCDLGERIPRVYIEHGNLKEE